ncbi:unnamed protein product [Amoebophrya sp. A25]|nr:unnamed protein product [Amoebophrya sp. A25]|eukprot:GSA25T00026796001.1
MCWSLSAVAMVLDDAGCLSKSLFPVHQMLKVAGRLLENPKFRVADRRMAYFATVPWYDYPKRKDVATASRTRKKDVKRPAKSIVLNIGEENKTRSQEDDCSQASGFDRLFDEGSGPAPKKEKLNDDQLHSRKNCVKTENGQGSCDGISTKEECSFDSTRNTNTHAVFSGDKSPIRSHLQGAALQLLRRRLHALRHVAFLCEYRTNYVYSVDLFSPEFGFAIEIDGPHHFLHPIGSSKIEDPKHNLASTTTTSHDKIMLDNDSSHSTSATTRHEKETSTSTATCHDINHRLLDDDDDKILNGRTIFKHRALGRRGIPVFAWVYDQISDDARSERDLKRFLSEHSIGTEGKNKP